MTSSPRLIDLTGQRFGRLTALEHVGTDARQEALWRCRCDCGAETEVLSTNLRAGHTNSCGCLRDAISAWRMQTHEMSGTPEHTAWVSMLTRARNPKCKSYRPGVKVWEPWLQFQDFYADLGPKPGPEYQLFRLDPEGDFMPDNVRWMTKREMARIQYGR